MTEQTAIERISEEDKQPLMELLQSPAIVRRFEMACGAQAGSVMLNVLNAAGQNPDIWKCEPTSVINAALNAAAMRLSISPALGHACILPYKKYKKGTWEVESMRASFIPMKRGIRELAMRTNKYRVLNSFCVYKGQEWEENQMTGIGKITGKPESKKDVVGYGAYLLLFSGYEATDYMSYDEIMEHIKRFSPSWDKKENKIKPGTKWATDFDMMAEGVVLKRLIRTKGVMSESDKKALDELEADQSDNGPDLAALSDHDADVVEGETSAIDPKEAEYMDACEVTRFDGTKYGAIEDDKLQKVIDSQDAPAEKKKAAQIIIDWRKAHPKKSEDELIKELGF